MAAFLFIQIRVLRQEGWAAYRAAVGPLAQQFGGRYLVRGTAKIDVLEGSHDGRSLVVFKFPSMQAIQEFWTSPEHADLKNVREGAAELDVCPCQAFKTNSEELSKQPFSATSGT